MSNPYRTPPPRRRKPRDLELERFVDDLEDARIGAIVEHGRIACAGLVAALSAGWWLIWGLDTLMTSTRPDFLNDMFWLMGGFTVLCFGFYTVAIYAFHIVYRVLLGRSVEWPTLHEVAATTAALR